MKIFWSWQSDNHQPSGRHFVRSVLAALAAELREEVDAEDAERPENDVGDDEGAAGNGSISVDHDTLDVGGSPPIADTILRKIREAAVFVADVTPVATTRAGKKVPNPNVMIELGYALKVLQHERIVLVMNIAEGAGLKYLPFDLRHWRAPASYSLHRDATEEQKAEAVRILKEGLRGPITHSLKAAQRDWSAERRLSHREPDLEVVRDPKDPGPWNVTQTVRDLGVKSLEQIKSQTPLLPLPPVNRLQSLTLSPQVSSSLASFGMRKPISQWSREETEGYNNSVEQYYAKYGSYLGAIAEHRRLILRTFSVKLLVINGGTAPATGIDVEIIFPEGVKLYERDDEFPKKPEPPEPPPQMPLAPGQGLARAALIDPGYLLSPYSKRSIWIDPKEGRVHYQIDQLKHNYQREIEDFEISFVCPSDIKSFYAEYTITVNEVVDPFEGEIHFECNKT